MDTYYFVRFTANWCGPCKSIANNIREFETKFDIPVQTVDVDSDAVTAEKYNVEKLPTLLVVNRYSQKEQERVTGANLEQIEILFSKYSMKNKTGRMKDLPFSSDATYTG